jgi:hypothetical protein
LHACDAKLQRLDGVIGRRTQRAGVVRSSARFVPIFAELDPIVPRSVMALV